MNTELRASLKQFFTSAVCIHAVIGKGATFKFVSVESIEDAARANRNAYEQGDGHQLCGLLGLSNRGGFAVRCDPEGHTTMLYAAYFFGRQFPALAAEGGLNAFRGEPCADPRRQSVLPGGVEVEGGGAHA